MGVGQTPLKERAIQNYDLPHPLLVSWLKTDNAAVKSEEALEGDGWRKWDSTVREWEAACHTNCDMSQKKNLD